MNSRNSRTTIWAILNLVFYFSTLVINSLGSSGFFNNMGQKDVSDKYTTLITPAGFSFSIWGVIYTLVLINLIYFVIKRKEDRVSRLVQMISPLFIFSCLMNMGWILAFSYEMLGISTILIFGMLISLMLIIEKIYKNRADISYFLPGLGFTLYASWVFIATILNISLFLVQLNWGGFGISSSIWTIIILFIAIAFVLFYLKLYKNAVFPISLAWAFFGIYSSYSSGVIAPPMATSIQIVLLFGIGVFILAAGITFVKNGSSIFPRRISYKINRRM